ncbi:MAG: outer membrane protein assembly factor BamD [Sandaracinaceae bacterium]
MRALAPLALALVACGGPQNNPALSYGENARRAYQNAFEAFEDGDCLTAEPLFSRIRSEYPYSRFAALSELRLADCHLQQNRPIRAIQAYRAFIRARPGHPDIEYAEFKVASAYVKQIPGGFFLAPPPQERDQTATREALSALRSFINDHPDSEYLEEAQEMFQRVIRLLALHELYAAEFYLNLDRPSAAARRLRTLMTRYGDSDVVPQALLLLGRVYLRMREVREARRTFEELVERFPDSGYARQAESFLSRFET